MAPSIFKPEVSCSQLTVPTPVFTAFHSLRLETLKNMDTYLSQDSDTDFRLKSLFHCTFPKWDVGLVSSTMKGSITGPALTLSFPQKPEQRCVCACVFISL